MGSDRKMDSKTDSKPMLAELWYDQLITGPIRHHPLHDTINISQRLRAAAAHFQVPRSAPVFQSGSLGMSLEHPYCEAALVQIREIIATGK